MSFRVNTNINALNAHAQATFTSVAMRTSLERLSSGLRINKAADDASGMAIADSLRNQANALGQAIMNANDGLGIIQIADKAMDEQIKILDTIKTKATQAAQDGQTAQTRAAIQADINRLIEGLDNIAATTSFNGQALLSGAYTNKEFQVGAYSNITIKASIGATSSDKIGNIRLETYNGNARAAGSFGVVTLTFNNVDGVNDFTLESVKISHSAGTGVGVLADTINKNADKLGVKASWTMQITGTQAVSAGNYAGITINGVTIGNISGVAANDADGRLVAAINNSKDRTGVEASIDETGALNLRSLDGRGIRISGSFGAAGLARITAGNYVGRLTLVRLDSRDIDVTGYANVFSTAVAQANVNLRDVRGSFDMTVACAAGAFANGRIGSYFVDNNGIGAGVTSLKGAMITMDIADTAMKMLDKIRSDLGSVSNQLTSTINNITITQVNVKSAESNIREVDFAQESAQFSKLNILAQSGSYAMSQANAVQQNILRLLQ